MAYICSLIILVNMKKYLLFVVCLSVFALCPAETVYVNTASFSNTGLYFVNETESESVNSQIEYSESFTDPWGFRVYAGYGRRLDRMNPELEQSERMLASSMVNGIVFGSDFIVYFNSARTCGFGFKFQMMHSGGSSMMKVQSHEGRFKSKVNITYLGPVYSQRFALNGGENVLMYNVGLGWLLYDWTGTINNAVGSISGKTAGLTLDLNYSRMIKEKLGIGVDLSFTTGALSSYDTPGANGRTTQKLEQKEGLTQMGLSLQLLYKF